MKLLIYYTVISTVLDVAAALLCLAIEQVAPWASLATFLILFFLILWVAWIAAVRLTEPETQSAPLDGAPSDQRA